MAATFYKDKQISSITVGSVTGLSKIIRVREEIASSQGKDLVNPLLVANTIAPVGVMDNHKWWEPYVELDQDDQATIFATQYISPIAGTTTTLGVSVGFTLIIYEVNTAGQTRNITYTNTHIKNWESETVDMKSDYQPRSIRFLSYGTRAVTAWT